MNLTKVLLMILVAIFGGVIVVGCTIKNGHDKAVVFDEAVKTAWAQVENQLQRRFELIPNLVETVKGYASHEREVLENVTRARSMLEQAGSAGQAAQADNVLTGALRSLFAVSENYPQLRANENFLELQRELSDIEEKIAFARQFYNRNVVDFNTRIQVFPSVIIANMFNFERFDFFEAEEAAREDVQVSFTSST